MYQLVYDSTLRRLKYNIRNLIRYWFNDDCDLSQKLRFSMLTINYYSCCKNIHWCKTQRKNLELVKPVYRHTVHILNKDLKRVYDCIQQWVWIVMYLKAELSECTMLEVRKSVVIMRFIWLPLKCVCRISSRNNEWNYNYFNSKLVLAIYNPLPTNTLLYLDSN